MDVSALIVTAFGQYRCADARQAALGASPRHELLVDPCSTRRLPSCRSLTRSSIARRAQSAILAWKFALFAALATCAWSGVAQAESKKDPRKDVPNVQGARETNAKSFMWVTCQPIPNSSPRQARCTFSQWLLNPKKSTMSDNEKSFFTEMQRTGSWPAEAAKRCGASTKEARAPKTPELAKFHRDYRAACRAKDGRSLATLLLSFADKEARTCSVTFYSSEDVFVQQDQNTWTNTGSAPCGTYVRTFWRDADDGDFWSYSQAILVPPNAPSEGILRCDQLPTRTDWRWWDRPPLPLGCEFVN